MFIGKDEINLIELNEGDYGIILPITVEERIENSKFTFIVYDKDEHKLFEVECENSLTDINTIEIKLSKENSEKLKEGKYLWSLIEQIEGELKNSIVVKEEFYVREGA